MKLSSNDRVAIDSILNHSFDSSPGGAPGAAGLCGSAMNCPIANVAADLMSVPHGHAVERLLNLLHTLPAQEPPADLVARTLARIDRPSAQTRAALINLAAAPMQ